MVDQNFALASRGAVATGYNTNGTTYVPANTIDGSDTTQWRCLAPVAGNYLEIDLGAQWPITGFRLLQGSTSNNQATRVRVEFSDTGLSWSLAWEQDVSTQEVLGTFGPYSARWWKFTAITGGTSGWYLYTAEVLGEEPTAPALPPGGEAIPYYIQWLYDYAYQAAADKLEELDPGWSFSIVETFLLAGMATCVAMFANLPTGGSGDLQDVLDALSTHDTQLNTRADALGILIGVVSEQLTALDDNIFKESLGREIGLVGVLANATSSITANDNTNTSGLVTHINSKTAEVIAALPEYEPVDLQPVLTAIAGVDEAVVAALPDPEPVDLQPVLTAVSDLAATVGSNQTALMGNVDAAESAIIEALSGLGGGNQWPGLDKVTLGTPVAITGPALIGGPMAGVLVVVNGTISGQSRQPAEGLDRFKGLGWVAFRCDGGGFEPKQSLENSLGLFVPQSIVSASACAVYCKPGSSISVTPYTLQAP